MKKKEVLFEKSTSAKLPKRKPPVSPFLRKVRSRIAREKLIAIGKINEEKSL